MTRFELVCVIYPCTPLLLPEDLHCGMGMLLEFGSDFAYGVGLNPLRDAGAFYWGTRRAFVERKPLVGPNSVTIPIPEERVCDINTMSDWFEAERKYVALKGNV